MAKFWNKNIANMAKYIIGIHQEILEGMVKFMANMADYKIYPS